MFLNFIFDYRFNLRREQFLSIEKKLWVLSIMIFYYLIHLLQVIFLALLLNWKLVHALSVHAVSPHIAAQHAPVIPLACTRFEHSLVQLGLFTTGRSDPLVGAICYFHALFPKRPTPIA